MKQLAGETRRIQALRERLLQRLLWIIAAAGVVAYGPSAYLSVREGLWVVFAADTVACVSAVGLALFRAIPFRIKVGYLVVMTYALGGLLLLYTGPFGAGHLYLFAFVFLAALFGEIGAMVAANAVALVTHLGFFLATHAGILSWPQGSGSVLVVSVNSLLVSAVLSVSANYLLRGYAAVAAEEERLREALEVLLKELEHRVMNNLQVISSLVSLRARTTEDPRRALEDISQSLSAVSVVHQLLYRPGTLNLVDVKVLLGSLVDRFRHLFRSLEIGFDWAGPKLEIDGDRAVSLGILINEIVTNSSKHAFGPTGQGAVSIRIEHDPDGDETVLSVGDNGRGMEPGTVEGIGLKIIRALARQLEADMELTSTGGVRYRFSL